MKKDIVDHYDHTWKDYDEWYESHPALYRSELAALKPLIPSGAGLEVGVGTGRFASPLGIRFGVDPAIHMLRLAKQRGLPAVQGWGECLPFKNNAFDFVLIVFVIEFADDPLLFLREAARTIHQDGALILGMIDRDSAWGNYFIRDPSHRARFHPAAPSEMVVLFGEIGLQFREAFQVLFQPPPDIAKEEEPRAGFGQGGFVVLKATKRQTEERR